LTNVFYSKFDQNVFKSAFDQNAFEYEFDQNAFEYEFDQNAFEYEFDQNVSPLANRAIKSDRHVANSFFSFFFLFNQTKCLQTNLLNQSNAQEKEDEKNLLKKGKVIRLRNN
jgi:hypothetical protein